jgi:hypothetical protein
VGNNYKFFFIDCSCSMTKYNNNLFLSNRSSPVIVRSCGRRRPVKAFAGEPAVSGQPTVFRTTTGSSGSRRFAGVLPQASVLQMQELVWVRIKQVNLPIPGAGNSWYGGAQDDALCVEEMR